MKKRSLRFNYIINLILTLSTFLFPLITFPYVSRVLLPEGMGKVRFATSLISYFTMLAQLGIPTYGIRACAAVRDDRRELTRTVHELLLIQLIMSALSYLGLTLSLLFVPRLQAERLLFIVMSVSILLSSVGMEWLYSALEQYTYITARSLFFRTLAVAATFLLVRSQSDYVLYGGVSILAASFSNILNLLNAHKYIDFRRPGRYDLKRHLKSVAVFFALACATTVYTNLDSLMLGFMTTDAEVGYYDAAVRIKLILSGVVASLGTVLLPRLSYYVERGELEEFRRVTEKALRFVFLSALPLTLYFMLFAAPGIYLLSGPAYTAAILPMRLIMPTVFLIGLTNLLGLQIMVPLGREKTVLYSVVLGAAVDLLLNALLIPRMGASGAAIGTLAAEAAVLVFQLAALRGMLREAFRRVAYGRLALALALGTLASLWLLRVGLGHFMTLLVSAILFFGVYGLSLLLTGEELTKELCTQALRSLRALREKLGQR